MRDAPTTPAITDFTRAIAPVTPETLFAHYFENQHVVVHRAGRDYFRDLLSVADIDAVLTGTMLPAAEMNMVNTGQPIPAERPTTATGDVDPVRAAQAFAARGTIILPGLQRRLPALAAHGLALEQVFSCNVQTNIDVTPDNPRGFHTHDDSHDVIVLQGHGSKTWKIYASPIELPLRSQPFDPEGFTPGMVTDAFVLQAGDMAYVPRGVVHDAIATTEMSLHITSGLLGVCWADLLLDAVAADVQNDADLRRSVSPGLAKDGAGLTAAAAHLRAFAARLADGIEPERILKGHASDFRARRAPVVPGHFLAQRRGQAPSGRKRRSRRGPGSSMRWARHGGGLTRGRQRGWRSMSLGHRSCFRLRPRPACALHRTGRDGSRPPSWPAISTMPARWCWLAGWCARGCCGWRIDGRPVRDRGMIRALLGAPMTRRRDGLA